MFYRAFEKQFFQKIIIFLLLCAFFSFQLPSPLFADTCILTDPEDQYRTKKATVLVGATLIALVGGVAYAAFGSHGSCHKHHSSSSRKHHSSYSHSAYYTNFDPLFPDSRSSNHSHDKHRQHHHDSYDFSSFYSSNPYSIFSKNNVSSFSGDSNPEFLAPEEIGVVGREKMLPKRIRKTARSETSKEISQLSGKFISHPSLAVDNPGTFTAFVHLPDGTTQILGRVSFSNRGGTSLSFGPFTQKGPYAFGIRLDQGTLLPKQVEIGSIEIDVNGSTVQNGEFIIPAHSPANYESNFYYYDLL